MSPSLTKDAGTSTSTSALDLTVPDPGTATRATKVRWAVQDGVAVARRNLTHVRHVPEKLSDVTVQPVMFVLLFVYVFGSAIKVPGDIGYAEFLMAGIFVQTVAFAVASASVSIADDVQKGVVDRFRSLPMDRSAVLVGRTTADLAAAVLGVVVLAVTGLLVGWRVHTSVFEVLAGFGVLLLFGYAMQWVGTLLGLLVRAPDAAQGIAFIVAFPLTFLANTFVPTDGLPNGLRQIAEWNPVSAVVAALRDLFGNGPAPDPDAAWPLAHPVVAAVAWCLIILAISVPLAIARYRRTTSR